MRKILLIIVMLGGIISAGAQDAGKIWVGGSIGFSTSKKTDLDRTYDYNVLPEFGYIVSENVGIGINLGYAHSETSYNEMDIMGELYNFKYKSDGFKVNPFVRVSFLKGDIGSLFVDGGVGYAYTKNKYGNESREDDKTNAFDVGLSPGIALNVSDKVILTAKYGFLGYNYSKTGDVKTDTFGFNFNFNRALFGVNFIF